MQRFDFKKTLKIMQQMRWQWADEKITIAGLKDLSIKLFENVAEKKGDCVAVSTGGLEAIRYYGHYALRFVPVEAGSE